MFAIEGIASHKMENIINNYNVRESYYFVLRTPIVERVFDKRRCRESLQNISKWRKQREPRAYEQPVNNLNIIDIEA